MQLQLIVQEDYALLDIIVLEAPLLQFPALLVLIQIILDYRLKMTALLANQGLFDNIQYI